MKVAIIPVTPFQQNCSLLVDERTNKAAVVDPGGEVTLEVRHCPGHAPVSTFGEQRASNPYVSDRALGGGPAGRGRPGDF